MLWMFLWEERFSGCLMAWQTPVAQSPSTADREDRHRWMQWIESMQKNWYPYLKLFDFDGYFCIMLPRLMHRYVNRLLIDSAEGFLSLCLSFTYSISLSLCVYHSLTLSLFFLSLSPLSLSLKKLNLPFNEDFVQQFAVCSLTRLQETSWLLRLGIYFPHGQ
jgi:hypothetical protein